MSGFGSGEPLRFLAMVKMDEHAPVLKVYFILKMGYEPLLG